uniref:Uncharacterized protein n=1 Tax=Globodera rostochiensis TaxID=31243 RepID=A0A914HF36_GLORO
MFPRPATSAAPQHDRHRWLNAFPPPIVMNKPSRAPIDFDGTSAGPLQQRRFKGLGIAVTRIRKIVIVTEYAAVRVSIPNLRTLNREEQGKACC